MDEEAVKIGLVNHPDLYQFIGNKALSDPRFAGLVPCDEYKKAVKNKTYLHTLNTQALITVTNLPKFFDCLEDSEKAELFKDEYLIRSLPADHIGDMLERLGTQDVLTVEAVSNLQMIFAALRPNLL